jgi:hypothetical protein
MIKFICPHCEKRTKDVPTGDQVLKDGYILECDKCNQCTTVKFFCCTCAASKIGIGLHDISCPMYKMDK